MATTVASTKRSTTPERSYTIPRPPTLTRSCTSTTPRPRDDGRTAAYPPDHDSTTHAHLRHITPSEHRPSPGAVQKAFERLYTQLSTNTSHWPLFGRPQRTTFEWLIVSDGGDAAPIRYLVGTTDDTLQSIRTPLSQLFPNTYEFRELECHPGALLTPERPDDGPYVAGVEFSPFCHRPLDWQTRLTPYGDPGDRQRSYRRGHQQPTQVHTVEDTATLAGLLETMARAEFPMLYQVLLRPKPDWSAQLIDRRYRIENYRDTLGSALVEELMPPVDTKDTRSLRAGDEHRLEELNEKDARRSFDVTVRAAVIGKPHHWDDPWPVHRAPTN